MPAIKFEAAEIEKLRKSFLQLMRAVESVADIKDAKMVREAVITWSNNFEHTIYKEIVPAIPQSVDNKELAKVWDSDIRSDCWKLYIEMSSGASLFDPFSEKYHYLDKDAQQQAILQDFLKNRKTWLNRVRIAARTAWKTLDSYIKSVGTPTRVTIPKLQEDVHGFSVTWIGDFERPKAQVFAQALKVYQERASKVLPLLLRRKLPMMAWFKPAAGDRIDEGGSYEHGPDRTIKISLFWYSKSTDVNQLVLVIAHEHGHHVYSTHLSDADQKYWSAAITGSYGDLKLSEIVKKWPDSAASRGFYSLADATHESDPIFSIQVGVLAGGHGGRAIVDFRSREDAEQELAKGDQTYHVPKYPISAYASKNSEESFCEAVGHLVAYGPRGIHPQVAVWLTNILPEITIGGVMKSVAGLKIGQKLYVAAGGFNQDVDRLATDMGKLVAFPQTPTGTGNVKVFNLSPAEAAKILTELKKSYPWAKMASGVGKRPYYNFKMM